MSQRVSTEQLLALAAGELEAAEAAHLRALVAGDRQSERELARIETFLRAARGDALSEPGAGLVARTIEAMERAAGPGTLARLAAAFNVRVNELAQVAASLIFDGAAGPALAGFRGSPGGGEGEGVHLSYTSELGEIDVRIDAGQGVGGTPGAQRALRGQFAAATEDEAEAVYLLRVDETGQQPAHADVDERGRFVLHGVPGSYEIVVRCRRSLITLREVVVT